ncbi:MAG: hypothetical protein AAF560_13300 [Acidobacteriota bacterium]
MGKYSKLRRNLLDLGALNRALSVDTELALKGLGRAFRNHERADQKTEDLIFDCCFWNRITVRAFFAHMEGLSYFMRRTAALPRNAAALNLTNRQRATLLELRYDRARDRITKTIAPNRVGDNLKMAFRFYPRVFGTDFRPDLSSPTWKALKRILASARNDMMHTGTFEDFYAVEAAQTLRPCIIWFLGSMHQMLVPCYEQVGVSVGKVDLSLIRNYEFDEASFRQIKIPREEFSRKVAEFQGRSWFVFQRSMFLLWQESSKSFEYYNSQSKIFGQDSATSQFAIRNCFRTLINYVEGATSVFRLYIEHAVERGEVDLTSEQEDSLDRGDVFERLVATFGVFSAKFGDGSSFEASEEHWVAVRKVLSYRDSLTHPRSIRDLEIRGPGTLNLVSNCLGWLVDVLNNTKFDADSIIEQGKRSGSIIPAAKESRPSALLS